MRSRSLEGTAEIDGSLADLRNMLKNRSSTYISEVAITKPLALPKNADGLPFG
jgi:hypothetical protein